jgi:hypothetical protein
MRRWSVFVVLAVIVLGLLIAVELQTGEGADGEGQKTVRLTTRTPTVTRTVGWWEQVVTWTPTPTGQGTLALPSITPMPSGTPTPHLPTVVLPTLRPTWTEGPR